MRVFYAMSGGDVFGDTSRVLGISGLSTPHTQAMIYKTATPVVGC